MRNFFFLFFFFVFPLARLTNSSFRRETDVMEHQGIFATAQTLNPELRCLWPGLFLPVLLAKDFWGLGVG